MGRSIPVVRYFLPFGGLVYIYANDGLFAVGKYIPVVRWFIPLIGWFLPVVR
jgi:hypothetical protein